MTRTPALLIAAGLTILVMVGAFAAIEARQLASQPAAAAVVPAASGEPANLQLLSVQPAEVPVVADAQYQILSDDGDSDHEEYDDHDDHEDSKDYKSYKDGKDSKDHERSEKSSKHKD